MSRGYIKTLSCFLVVIPFLIRKDISMSDVRHIHGIAELADVQLPYEITGQGHPLVLVHAGLADRRMWDEQVLAFAQQYQVIRYDLRGYGESVFTTSSCAHYQDLHDLLSFLHISSAYFVGCSLGGMTIVDFALTYPDMVDALIPVCCFPEGYWTRNPTLKQPNEHILKMIQDVQALMVRGDIDAAADREADYFLAGPNRMPYDPLIPPAFRTYLHETNRIAKKNEVTVGKELSLDPPAITRLSELQTPTLVISGDQDDADVIKGYQILATCIPGAQKASVVDTAHFPNIEKPAIFNKLVLDFLVDL
jgi:3-oxoadipate enol-lactonase